jgi:hypothetical protein
MLLRPLLLFALASVFLMANEQKQVPGCCEPESEKLSQSKVKALVEKTEPIHAPCCADMLHISGTVVLAISVDPQGNVACVQTVSGSSEQLNAPSSASQRPLLCIIGLP